MNKYIIVLVFFTVVFSQCTSLQVSDGLKTAGKIVKQNNTLSTEEVSKGLKEALVQGAVKGSSQASQLNGYFKNKLLKIVVPPEMLVVNQKLRSLGMNRLMDDFEMSLNRGAEEAAKEAKPIFVSAITSLTIQDAWKILKGEPDAATFYLKRTTGNQLETAFTPIIKNSLQKVNATKYYSDIITMYNQIPMVEKVNPELEKYVTEKAIEGLFTLIKQEEENIREHPAARVTELLKKVFSSVNQK